METKVLIADDEKEVLELLAKKISMEGYQVITATDGQDAWEKIRAGNPDIIILDVDMPRIDGFGVLKNLRENPPSDKWQPVIIVSALGELESIKKGYSLEADHYITKPCQMETVLNAIKTMVNLIPQRKIKE